MAKKSAVFKTQTPQLSRKMRDSHAFGGFVTLTRIVGRLSRNFGSAIGTQLIFINLFILCHYDVMITK